MFFLFDAYAGNRACAENREFSNSVSETNDSVPERSNTAPDSNPKKTSFTQRFIHKLGVEYRPGYIFPTNSFLAGDNRIYEPFQWGYSAHLKYAFQFKPNTRADRIYGGAYQGIGVGYYDFGSKEELGNPTAIYLYQGARIARITSRLSLNYEWNFGLSFGWKPYDQYENPNNTVIGSKANAYLNAGVQLNWMVMRQVDLIAGVSATHFSNGNTKFPNTGLNTIGLKVGVIYNFNRPEEALTKPVYQTPVPEFQRHVSYDLTMFGSWRRKGVFVSEGQIASPHSYTVLGFNFAPMYNIGYKFRTGVSLDGVYDASANVYTIPGNGDECYQPPFDKQIALGISGRAEYVMPYFTVGVGIGANILHSGNDHKGIYQVLTLKVELTRSSYLHIGYNLKDFKNPNFLMLGLGLRFNNKYPTSHRR